jgi:hypothetical protein
LRHRGLLSIQLLTFIFFVTLSTAGAQTRNANARTATLTIDDLKTEIAKITVILTAKVSTTITTNKNTQLTGSF